MDHEVAVQSLRERLPRLGLGAFVTCVWIQEVAPGSRPYLYQMVPNGSAELVWTIGSYPRIVGPQTGPQETLLPGGTVAVGVRFRPGAACAVLGAPAQELVDLDIEAADVCGRWVRKLDHRVEEASSPEAALAAVEDDLAVRFSAARELDPVVIELVQKLLRARDDNVHTLARTLYLSERQLRRRCENAVGVTPKTLQRIFRFRRFLALANADDADTSPDLGRLAHQAGYADQSHLSRETQRLAGLSPRSLLHEWALDCSAHDHTASYRPFQPGTAA